MKDHINLSVLVVLAAAESATEECFQRRRHGFTRLTVSRTLSRHSTGTPFKSLGAIRTILNSRKADTESGRVLPKSSTRKKSRESLHLHMSTSVEAFVRSVTDQRKQHEGSLGSNV